MPSSKIGGVTAKLDKVYRSPPQAHDIITHSIKTRESKCAEFRALYEQGLSLRQIQSRTGNSKTKIRKTLSAAGVAIRDFSGNHRAKLDLTQVVRPGNTPFGYCYLEGKLVVDPREYKVVLEMYRLWKNGQSLRAISRHLNSQRVPTRFGKSWKHEVVKKIIERHEQELKQEKK